MVDNSIRTAGIDIAKDKLDVAVLGCDDSGVFENNDAGFKRLAAWLAAAGVSRVGVEATGGYERGVVRHLRADGFTVVVLQPLQVRAFAKMRLQRAKNDKIDARLIAACTEMLAQDSRLPPDPRFDVLADHLTFIEQIEDDIVRCKTRLEHITDKRLVRIVAADIKRLEQRRAAELKRLTDALCAHADLRQRFDLVLSIPGIGARTALATVVRMPELGQVSREEVAALAGLAPFVQQSGQWKGQMHIGGGRARLRESLYAASLPAAFRWNPPLMAFYEHLRARGKSHKCALVACARKLLIYANTVVARGTPWRQNAASA